VTGNSSSPTPARVRSFDIEGHTVRCIETDDGKRIRLCKCADLQERDAWHPEGFCAHTALAIRRCVDEGLIDIR